MSETAASPATAAAPASAPATPAAPAPATAATPAATEAPGAAAPALPTARSAQAAAIERASAEGRAEQRAAAGLPPEEGAAAPGAPPAAEKEPEAKVEPKTEPKVDDDKASPTARIAALAAENRQHRAAIKQFEAKLAEAEASKTTTAAEAKQLADVRAAFKKDPLEALKIIGESWSDIVERVATGGVPPTAEQIAADKAAAEAAATAARLKKLEDEREAEKTEAQKAADAAQFEAAKNIVATKFITAEKYPKLVAIAEEAAVEALAQVDLALETAFKQGKRATRHPVDLDESMRLTHSALEGLNNFYTELVTKLGGVPAAQQTAATTEAAPAAQPAAPAVQTVQATSQQQRGPETLTPAVVGRLPPATETRPVSADVARARAIELAALLPPL